ncbi:MAG: DNA mismatch repair endonuclease MutL [Deferribacteres bacterium]|nr:DNA mismatch repair endonuclease MutL [Deferribacteres bacterium]
MPKVKRLSPLVIKRIAAGEVVERPASVVKELVENSLDADSSRIVVRVEDGGKRLIEVSDNGTGMSEEDALLAVERYTTSKIESPSDLEAITTLGFRGEALYAISSVSMFVMTTKREEDDVGTKVVVHGGVLKEVSRVPRERGTTVSVRNLFFNLRARRKFLRSKRTEESHVRRVLMEYAVCCPHVEFEYYEDGQPYFLLPRASVEDRLSTLLGDVIDEKALEDDGLVLKLFLVKTARFQGDIFFFVNKRAVWERALFASIRRQLKQKFLSWELPAVVLFAEVNPAMIDVNVHPSKREVKFKEREKLFEKVLSMISEKKSFLSDASGTSYPFRWKKPDRGQESTQLTLETGGGEEALSYRFVGEYAGVFLLYEDLESGDLVVVDKHAFHERLIFDAILGDDAGKQPVFIPFPGLKELACYEKLFSFLGFDVDFESEVVLSVPSWARGREESVISELCFLMKNEEVSDLSHEELARKACRAAVKAGDTTSYVDAGFVIKVLQRRGFDLSCPHGRPVVVRLKKSDFESFFKRRR